jgi:NAD(P)-dependent dehydrogenase (short-subunit alcohol dehydrogenase family)
MTSEHARAFCSKKRNNQGTKRLKSAGQDLPGSPPMPVQIAADSYDSLPRGGKCENILFTALSFSSSVPLGRLGKSEEIAKAVVFLASD